eukprot:scaffold64430_cov47-Phaeocystis_antarctica.AAC.2
MAAATVGDGGYDRDLRVEAVDGRRRGVRDGQALVHVLDRLEQRDETLDVGLQGTRGTGLELR